MIQHDKCAEFEAKILELQKVIEDQKDEIEKLNLINGRLRNDYSRDLGIQHDDVGFKYE